MHLQDTVVEVMNRIFLLQGDLWSAEVVQGAVVPSYLKIVHFEWQGDLDVAGTLWQDHSHCVIFGQRFVILVHEINFKGVLLHIVYVLE